MKSFHFFVMSLGVFVLGSCIPEELENSKEGEIVWIGNGLQFDREALLQSTGLVVDFRNESGWVYSAALHEGELRSFVKLRDTQEPVFTKLDWAAPGEKQEPVLKLDFPVDEAPCSHFETLQNGDLVCRMDLEGISIHPDFAPVFLIGGQVVFFGEDGLLRALSDSGVIELSVEALQIRRGEEDVLEIEVEPGVWKRFRIEDNSLVAVEAAPPEGELDLRKGPELSRTMSITSKTFADEGQLEQNESPVETVSELVIVEEEGLIRQLSYCTEGCVELKLPVGFRHRSAFIGLDELAYVFGEPEIQLTKEEVEPRLEDGELPACLSQVFVYSPRMETQPELPIKEFCFGEEVLFVQSLKDSGFKIDNPPKQTPQPEEQTPLAEETAPQTAASEK